MNKPTCIPAATLLATVCVTFLPIAAVARDGIQPEDRAHWAFQKITRPAVPAIKNLELKIKNPVDAFIAAELEAKGIAPAPATDKITLLRRASLDLTGLPPTPEEVDAFLADNSSGAFNKVVDRLLASPRYGERWARHWLDLARYAESEGFKADETRPNAWRYRDYVIQSLNDDKPYDRFVQEQIAGDELWPGNNDALIATAFNRHYADESNARNLMQRRQEILNDITDTVGGVFLGMTYACARCHDHKFEPILQTDYYRLQAFFANTAPRDDVVLVPGAEQLRFQEKLAAWEEKTKGIREQMEIIEAPKRRAIERDYFEKYPPEIQAAWTKPEPERTPFERMMVWKARQYLDPKSQEYIADQEAVVAKLKGAESNRWHELKGQLDAFEELHPGALPTASMMTDIGREAPRTFLLSKGSYEKPKDEVAPGLMQILHLKPSNRLPMAAGETTGRRAELAALLTSPENPLTARVMVNRVWHYHFGRGLVGTPSDLGLKGDQPTHAALLDWLAAEFVEPELVERGSELRVERTAATANPRLTTQAPLNSQHKPLSTPWSLKHLHRLIMTSAAYQQSSAHREAAAKIDPQNRLLWKFPRQRLQGEVIRDSALAVAGLLNLKMGGPSVFPELPIGMTAPRGGWKVSAGEEQNRRSIYVFVRRNTRYPMFDSFDMPDPHESCSRRNVTTSPIQALTLLNSHLTLQWAQSFAGRVLSIAGNDAGTQIDAAYRLAYGRLPDNAERPMAKAFFKSHRSILAERDRAGEKLALPPLLSEDADRAHAATLVDFCHMLINANEFVYVN